MKKRLDVLLVERGLAESRSQAQALVLAGRVPGFEKPGMQVEESADVAVEQPPRFVSRGGEKLDHALSVLGLDVAGLDCLDVGASTGGFTDALLQRCAARVIDVDVGYGQLDPRLRADERVTVLERTNARYLDELPFAPAELRHLPSATWFSGAQLVAEQPILGRESRQPSTSTSGRTWAARQTLTTLP